MSEISKNLSNKIYYLVFAAIFCFCILFVFISGENSPEKYSAIIPIIPNQNNNINGIINEAQQCLIKHFSTFKFMSHWFEIADWTSLCTKDVMNYIPYMETTPGTVERKYYMMPRTPYINDSCSVISFGIGGDVSSELHIQMMLPHCTFLGFDPNMAYKSLFETKLGGTYIKAGVEPKDKSAKVLRINPAGDEWNKVDESNLKPASKLIEIQHGKDKLVDILNIDVEGFEYSIFDEMIKAKVYRNVCQINFEIHPVWYHDIGYAFMDVTKMWIDIAKDGTFLWAKTTSNRNITYCIYFVNVKNQKCVEKYLKKRLIQ